MWTLKVSFAETHLTKNRLDQCDLDRMTLMRSRSQRQLDRYKPGAEFLRYKSLKWLGSRTQIEGPINVARPRQQQAVGRTDRDCAVVKGFF